ncbi:MAG: zinc-ribbon domain-containing protein [Promethearchaeota archaeon]
MKKVNFCPACGAELEGRERYCAACGTPLSVGEPAPREVQVGTTREVSRARTGSARVSGIGKDAGHGQRGVRKKSHRGLLAFVVASIVVLASLGVITLFFVDVGGDYREFKTEYDSLPSALVLDIDSSIGSVHLSFTGEPDAPAVAMAYEVKWVGILTNSGAMTDSAFTYDENEVHFSGIDSTHSPAVIGSFHSSLSVVLREDVKFNISLDLGTGDLHLDTGHHQARFGEVDLVVTTGDLDAQFYGSTVEGRLRVASSTGRITLGGHDSVFGGGVDIATTTGGARINLQSVELGGNLSVAATTGDVDLAVRDATLTVPAQGSASWIVTTTTGDVVLNLNQYTPLGVDVTGVVSVTTGDVELNFHGNGTLVGARFHGSTSSGRVDLDAKDGGFLAPAGDSLVSSNFEGAPHVFDFSLTTTTGGVEVDAWNSSGV